MITKKTMTLSVSNKLKERISEHFDNKSKLTSYIIIQIISQNEKFKELTKNYCY